MKRAAGQVLYPHHFTRHVETSYPWRLPCLVHATHVWLWAALYFLRVQLNRVCHALLPQSFRVQLNRVCHALPPQSLTLTFSFPYQMSSLPRPYEDLCDSF